MTVTSRFQTLLVQIEPSARELLDYGIHHTGVARAVADLYPDAKCRTMGSHARDTAIGGTSDLDVLAILPNEALRRGGVRISSNTALENLRERLLDRYPSTRVRRDVQAIVVGFGGGARDIDVVPGAWVGMIDVPLLGAKRPVFDIPDASGGWMRTSPEAHNDYIEYADVRAGGKLKYVARLLRHWRRSRTPKVPMLTFHAELVLAQQGTCARIASYSHLLADAFSVLAARAGRALQDPLGISSFIPIASTEPKRAEVVKALNFAADHAAKAVMAENQARLSEAYAQWSIVFNGQFP